MGESIRKISPFLRGVNSSFTTLWSKDCLLKGLPKFKRHNAVQNRVYCTAGKITNAGDIVDYFVDGVQIIGPFCCRYIKGHQSLGMEWRPADEKSNHNGN